MAKFQIVKAPGQSDFYFHLRASGNHEIILRSEGYSSKYACETGINSVKLNAPYDYRYEKLFSTDRQYYFNLKGANGEIIGTSETYTTIISRDQAVELVKNQAPTAATED